MKVSFKINKLWFIELRPDLLEDEYALEMEVYLIQKYLIGILTN